MSILRDLFGPGTWGAGGNLVAWVLCGALGFMWLRAKLRAQETLARLHHQQKMAQAQAHHDEAMKLAGSRHEDMKAHVSAQAKGTGDGAAR